MLIEFAGFINKFSILFFYLDFLCESNTINQSTVSELYRRLIYKCLNG